MQRSNLYPLSSIPDFAACRISLHLKVMSRILVAVSSPWAAQKVLETVADLAKRLSAAVLVVHVSRPSSGPMREQEQSEGESALRLLRENLQSRGVAVQELLMFSEDIARAIVNTAVERDVTLIVLGLTGKNVFARLLAGNVPVELIRQTKIPVLILPPDWNHTI